MVDRLLYPFHPKKYSPDGKYNLSYVDEGKGPAIVMVHGNPTWSFFYRNPALALRKNYRIIIPDHMGMGLSDKPKILYNIKNHMENLESLLKHLNLDSFHLVVHDWGGPIGLNYATKYPEQIKSLTILNTAAFNSFDIPFRILCCKIPVLGKIIILGLNGFSYSATFMATHIGLSKKVKEGYLYPYKKISSRLAQLHFVQEIPLTPDHHNFDLIENIEKNLNRLKCKKLILWGEKDFCFNLSFFKRWREIYPEASFKTFPDAGHYLLEDKTNEVVDEMRNFLEKA